MKIEVEIPDGETCFFPAKAGYSSANQCPLLNAEDSECQYKLDIYVEHLAAHEVIYNKKAKCCPANVAEGRIDE